MIGGAGNAAVLCASYDDPQPAAVRAHPRPDLRRLLRGVSASATVQLLGSLVLAPLAPGPLGEWLSHVGAALAVGLPAGFFALGFVLRPTARLVRVTPAALRGNGAARVAVLEATPLLLVPVMMGLLLLGLHLPDEQPGHRDARVYLALLGLPSGDVTVTSSSLLWVLRAVVLLFLVLIASRALLGMADWSPTAEK